jgi:hypothetical protein
MYLRDTSRSVWILRRGVDVYEEQIDRAFAYVGEDDAGAAVGSDGSGWDTRVLFLAVYDRFDRDFKFIVRRSIVFCVLIYSISCVVSYDLFCASFCHARFHLRLSVSMVCAVLCPLSFSSRFMRVTAAARPIDTAKMGSRLLLASVSTAP